MIKSEYSIQILASSNVSLTVFANTFFDDERPSHNLRRNFLYLFDNMKNQVIKIDASIGISLVERKDQDRLKSKMELIHPNIPGARLGEQDRAALNLQSFSQ